MKMVEWNGWRLVFPIVNWQGSTWPGGHFGSARDPSGPVFIPGKTGRMHAGYDFGCAMREPLLAIADGVVTQTGYNSGAGNFVAIKHRAPWGQDYWFRALHIVNGGIKVREGQRVHAGEVYALAGSTGGSVAPHLHAELTIAEPYVPASAGKHVDIEFVFFGDSGRNGYHMTTEWQKILKKYGFYTGVVDGIPGPGTERALDAFAKKALEQTGGGGAEPVLLNHRHKNRLDAAMSGWVQSVGGPYEGHSDDDD